MTARPDRRSTAELARDHKLASGGQLMPAELARELVLELVDKYDDDRSTVALLERVAELVEPGSAAPRDPEGKPAKVGSAAHSPSPVTDGALHLLTDVHAGVRDLEARLFLARFGETRPARARVVHVHRSFERHEGPATPDGRPPGVWREHREVLAGPRVHRGDSAANTARALDALPDLLDGLPSSTAVVDDALRSLRSWHSRARDLIGTRVRWTPLRGHVCPYCELASLRQRPRDGALVCITPTCSTAPPDEPQVRPEWSFAEYGRAQLVIESTESTEATA